MLCVGTALPCCSRGRGAGEQKGEVKKAFLLPPPVLGLVWHLSGLLNMMCSLLLLSWDLLIPWFQCSNLTNNSSRLSEDEHIYSNILQQSNIYTGKHGEPSEKAIFSLLDSERNIPVQMPDKLKRLPFLLHYKLIICYNYVLILYRQYRLLEYYPFSPLLNGHVLSTGIFLEAWIAGFLYRHTVQRHC